MNYNTDRLDRIEADLETIKEILLATAKRAEAADERTAKTDELIREQNQIALQQGQKIDERLDRLSQNQEESHKQLDSMREDVDIAFETIKLLSENTDRSIAQSQQEMREFRAIMTQLQVENRQIWEYLMHQSQNGNSDASS